MNPNAQIISVVDNINLEYGIALFYMQYIAFGFVFSGTMGDMIDLGRDIEAVKAGWGYVHRN